MTYEKDTDLDINSIQEENLKMLQESMIDTSPELDSIQLETQEFDLKEIQKKPVADIHVEDVLKIAEEYPEGEAKNILELENAQLNEVRDEEDQKIVKLENDRSLVYKILGSVGFFFRYVLTASFIFVVLMGFTNYSAYITIAKSYLNPEAIEQSEKNIQNSIEQSQITINYEDEDDDNREEARAKVLEKGENKIYESKDIRTILGDIREEEISLDIEIIPFVNRLVIPKIGKNIPLIDIEQGNVEGLDELNDIFMDELEDGVVRYPGSAEPGEFGNAFIFGHSSNFPWMAGDYNDVFALLDRLEIGDEVVSYYEGQKYTYKIKQKEVINPNDVSVLKRETNKKELTLMTCWPIGTTYNRLLVIGELVN